MSIQHATEFSCGTWGNREVFCQAIEQSLSSDAGLLLFAQFDAKLGWTEEFALLVSDFRVDPDHSVLSMVQQRIFGIVAGYEDQNDHDTLRSDPIFKMISGRELGGKDLASQPTISRLENAVTAGDLLNMEAWFIEESKRWTQPRQLVIKCEATAHSTSRRVVISNRPEVVDDPESVNRSFVETKQDRKVHNDRRQRDPLGEGHPCTWRTHVIKVAVRIVVSARRVVLQLSASWPHLGYFRQVADAIDRYRPLVT